MNNVFTEHKSGFPKTVQFGRFVENAKRPAEIPFSLRISRSHALRGPASFSAILQIAQPLLLPSTSGSMATLQPSKLSPLAPRTLVAPSALGQTRQSQCAVASCKVSPPGIVYENSNCRLPGEADYLNPFATLLTISSLVGRSKLAVIQELVRRFIVIFSAFRLRKSL